MDYIILVLVVVGVSWFAFAKTGLYVSFVSSGLLVNLFVIDRVVLLLAAGEDLAVAWHAESCLC